MCQRPLLFIAHSFGGIIVKQALILPEADTVRLAVRGIIFLGTPHTGSGASWSAAWLAWAFSWFVGSKAILLKSLQWHSEDLLDLQTHFSAKVCVGNAIQIHSFYETKDTAYSVIPLGRIVDATSACLIGPQPMFWNVKIDKNHTALNKCIDENDVVYVEVCRAINSIVDSTFGVRAKHCLQQLASGAQNFRQSHIKRATRKTCEWITRLQAYKDWKDDPRSSAFWLVGKPGSGKSTVIAEALDSRHREVGLSRLSQMLARPTQQPSEHSKTDSSSTQLVLASFFYSVPELDNEIRHRQMLQSILFQALMQNPNLFQFYDAVFQQTQEDLTTAGSWTLEHLKAVLSALKKQTEIPLRFELYLDAADECESSDDLLKVVRFLSSVEDNHSSVFKILVATRPLRGREKMDFGSIVNFAGNNDDDIRTIVNGKMEIILEALREWPSEHGMTLDIQLQIELRKFEKTLMTSSDGVVLWICLILDEIAKRAERMELTVEYIKQRAFEDDFKDLDGIYLRILDSLDQQHGSGDERTQVKKWLSWATFASGLLSVQEFGMVAQISTFEADFMKQALEEARTPSLHPSMIEQTLNIKCGGLLELKSAHEDAAVGLLHRTVKPILQDIRAKRFQLSENDCHSMIALACVRYVKALNSGAASDDMGPTRPSSHIWCRESIKALALELNQHNLLPYVFRNLTIHLEKIRYHSTGGNQAAYIRLTHDMDAMDHNSGIGILFFNCFEKWNLSGLQKKHHAQTMLDLSVLAEVATEEGYLQTVKILDATGALDNDNLHALSLTTALSKERWLIWRYLTGRVAPVHDLDQTSLDIALNRVLEDRPTVSSSAHKSDDDREIKQDVAVWLLRQGANPSSISREHSLVHACARKGYDRVLQDLIEVRVDVASPDARGKTPLMLAAERGHIAIVELLLNAGVNTEVEDRYRQRAIDYAAQTSHESIVHALLQGGASPPRVLKNFIVPYARNPKFVGREDVLLRLQEHDLGSDSDHIAIVGLGGMGKTQVALEYAYRAQQSDPDRCIVWVNADSPASFGDSHRTLCQGLGFPKELLAGSSKETFDVFYTRLNQFSKHAPPLIIWDNLDSWDEEHERDLCLCLNRCTSSRVIITSRTQQFARKSRLSIIELGPFSEAESAAFVTAMSPELSNLNQFVESGIAEHLGGLPFAIAIATRYCKRRCFSLVQYSKILREDTLSNFRYYASYDAVWKSSLDSLEQWNKRAFNLLGAMSYLDPDCIPTTLFIGEPDFRIELQELIGVLRSFSFITTLKTQTDTVSIHRLVQDFVRRTMEKSEDFQHVAITALKAVDAAFPDEGFETWADPSILLPHARRVLDLHGQLGIDLHGQLGIDELPVLNSLRWKTARYLTSQRMYDEAKRLLQDIIVDMETSDLDIRGPVDVGLAIETLAQVLRQQHDHADI